MHISLKFKILTGQNRIGKYLKVKIPEESSRKMLVFCVFASPKNLRVRRGPWGGGEVEVERGRLPYVAACRSLGRFLRGGPGGDRTVFYFPKTPCFDTTTVEIGMCSVRGDPS